MLFRFSVGSPSRESKPRGDSSSDEPFSPSRSACEERGDDGAPAHGWCSSSFPCAETNADDATGSEEGSNEYADEGISSPAEPRLEPSPAAPSKLIEEQSESGRGPEQIQ